MSIAGLIRKFQLNIGNLSENLFHTDKGEARLGKNDAKELKKLVVEIIKELKEMGADIVEGEEADMKKHSNEAVMNLKKQLMDETHIHTIDDQLELKEIERLKEVLKYYEGLMSKVQEQKIRGILKKGIDDLRQLDATIIGLVDSIEKLSYNVKHNHAAVLRFIHIRDPKATANRAKVLMREGKSVVNKEKSEEHELLKLLSEGLKKGVNPDSAKKIVKETKKYTGLAMEEFEAFSEANKRGIQLMEFTVECISAVKIKLEEAEQKGYNSVDSRRLLNEVAGLVKTYNDATAHMNQEDKALQNAIPRMA